MGRKHRPWILLMVFFAMAALVATARPAPVRAGQDPEPVIPANLPYDIDPGPGLPAGWTPPAAPTAIPQLIIDSFNRSKQLNPNAPQNLEMRVMQPPLPNWTKEYPWLWTYNQVICGATRYVYWVPAPAQQFIWDTFHRMYQYGSGAPTTANCQVTPINVIKEDKPPTPEEQEQIKLRNQLDLDLLYARLGPPSQGGLGSCVPWDTDGKLDNIQVCFNGGDASAHFDAPAYLDTQVSRVRVPVRFVSEMMSAGVTWDESSQTVTIHFPAASRAVAYPVPLPGGKPGDWVMPNQYTFDGGKYKLALKTINQPERTIILTVGKEIALVDGKEVSLDAPPVIVPPGRTMVPVRFVSEVMGAKVYWVGNTPIFRRPEDTLGGRYQVHIYTPLWPYFDFPDWFLDTRAQKFQGGHAR
jgi:hypothetical protein